MDDDPNYDEKADDADSDWVTKNLNSKFFPSNLQFKEYCLRKKCNH